jgi:serine/threonine protein kinase
VSPQVNKNTMPFVRSAGSAQLLRDIPDHLLVPSGEVTIVRGSAGLVGKGANGEVHHALWNGTTYAAKDLKHLHRKDLSAADRAELHSDFAREASLLARCRHHNVLMLAGIVVDTSSGLPLFLMTELHQTNLHSVIQQHSSTGTTMPLSTTLNLAIELIRGVVYLHRSRNILHRDIKPSNLLCNNATSTLSIADFGEAQFGTTNDSDQDNWCVAGTPAYMAPEALCGDAVDAKSDIFSVGVTLLEMCTGKLPTPTAPRAVGASGRLVMVSEVVRRQHELESMSHGASMCELIRNCLADARSARPSASQLLQEVLAMRDDLSQPAHASSDTDTIEKLQMQVLKLQAQVSSASSSAASSPSSTGSFRMTAFGTAPLPEHGRSSDVDVFGDWKEQPVPAFGEMQRQMPSF